MATPPVQGAASTSSGTNTSNDGVSSRATSISRYESASSSPTRSSGLASPSPVGQWRSRTGSFATNQGNATNTLNASQYAPTSPQGQQFTPGLTQPPIQTSTSGQNLYPSYAASNFQIWNNANQPYTSNAQKGLSASTVPIFNPFGGPTRAPFPTGPYASSKPMSGPATPANTPASPASPFQRPSPTTMVSPQAPQQTPPTKPVDAGLTNWNERQASALLGNLARPGQSPTQSAFGAVGVSRGHPYHPLYGLICY